MIVNVAGFFYTQLIGISELRGIQVTSDASDPLCVTVYKVCSYCY